MDQLSGAIRTFKGMGVGSALGSLAGFAMFHAIPQLAALGFSQRETAIMGAAVAALISRTALAAAPSATYYRRHFEIAIELWAGLMMPAEAVDIRATLRADYYVGQLSQARGATRKFARQKSGPRRQRPEAVATSQNAAAEYAP